MSERDDILSRMDACRPDDLSNLSDEQCEPLRELLRTEAGVRLDYERIQAIDRRIGEALVRLPVPVGLAGRILDRLALELSTADVESASISTEFGMKSTPEREVGRDWGRIGRRAGVLFILSTAAALLAAFWLRPGPVSYSEDSIAQAARDFYPQIPVDGKLLEQFPPPDGFPISGRVLLPVGTRWQAIPNFLGRGGVVFRMSKGPLRAALYVFRLSGNPRAPGISTVDLPGTPQPTSTGGLTTAVWREREVLYVLVVEGGEFEYQQFTASNPVVA